MVYLYTLQFIVGLLPCYLLYRAYTISNEYKLVLQKIADPRLRDHKEPDAYTQLGCVMNMANEVLEKYKDE